MLTLIALIGTAVALIKRQYTPTPARPVKPPPEHSSSVSTGDHGDLGSAAIARDRTRNGSGIREDSYPYHQTAAEEGCYMIPPMSVGPVDVGRNMPVIEDELRQAENEPAPG